MAHFYGTVVGGRGEASRVGHKSTGIESNTKGWDSGVKVIGEVDKDGNDVFHIYQNAGSNGHLSNVLIGSIVDGVFMPSDSLIHEILETNGKMKAA